jgi:hypothetical protein
MAVCMAVWMGTSTRRRGRKSATEREGSQGTRNLAEVPVCNDISAHVPPGAQSRVGQGRSRPTAAVHGRAVDLSGMAALGNLALPNTNDALMLARVFQSQRRAGGRGQMGLPFTHSPIPSRAMVTAQGSPPYEPPATAAPVIRRRRHRGGRASP